MKKILVFFLFSLLFTAINAQKQSIDELKKSIQSVDNQQKVDKLNELSSRLTNTGSYDAITYAQQAFDLATQIHYPDGKAVSCDNLGLAYLSRNDFKNAMMQFVDGLKIRNELDDKKGGERKFMSLQ